MSTCSQCNGSGHVGTSVGGRPCPSCGGSGEVESSSSSSSSEKKEMSWGAQVMIIIAGIFLIGWLIENMHN